MLDFRECVILIYNEAIEAKAATLPQGYDM